MIHLKLKTSTIARYYVVAVILVFSITISYFVDAEGRNYLLIGFMVLSSIAFIFIHKLDKSEFLLFAYLGSITFIPPIIHYDTFRLSTILYTYLFAFTFIVYKRGLLRAYLSPWEFTLILKKLIYLYFFVLIMQQLCVAIGLPVINAHAYDVAVPWKLNVLSLEPSHTGRIIALIMYSFIFIRELVSNKKLSFLSFIKQEFPLFLAFSWIMLTISSTTALLLYLLLLLRLISHRDAPFLLFFAVSLIFLFVIFRIGVFERAFMFLKLLFQLDFNKMLYSDMSAALRIVPLVFLAKYLFSLEGFTNFFGNGVDSTGEFFKQVLNVPGIPDNFISGGVLYIWYEYGLLAFIFYLTYTLLNFLLEKDRLFSIIFWFLLVFMYTVNVYIPWFALVLFYSLKFYEDRSNASSKKSCSNDCIRC